MDWEDAIEVEIEFIFDNQRSEGHLVVRRLILPGPAIRLTPESTIGGCRIKSLGLGPRAFHSNGSLRFDLLVFELQNRLDCGQFTRGQRLVVKKIQIIHQ
jgi:hypothetical protein